MKLTKDQRAAFFAGEHPKLVYPGENACPVKPGDTYRLSPEWWIEIVEIKRARKGEHVARYHVHDMRTKPRLLAIQNGRRNASQYVTSRGQALPDEPEAVDPQTQERISDAARDRDKQRAVDVDMVRLAEKHSLEQRLGELRTMARERGIDVRSDVRIIERRLEAIERKVRRAA